MQTDGLHHNTAVAGDPPEGPQFDTGTPGLGLLKRTAGGHDATTYHREYHTRPETVGADLGSPADGGRAE